MTDNEKVRLIGKMIEDYWGMTTGDGAEAQAALILVEMIGTVVDFE